MRRNRLLCCAAVAAAGLLGCSCSSSSSSTSSSPSPSPSPSSTTACQYTSDVVTAVGLVYVVAAQSSVKHTVSPGKPQALPCGTTVIVGGQAMVQFGTQGGCTLQELNNQSASLISRDPAFDLLTLNSGFLQCNFTGPISYPSRVQCPGYATVVAQDTQLYVICVPGATFEVAVYRGSANVVDLAGKSHPVAARRGLYAEGGAFKPEKATFTRTEINAFNSLVAESG